MMDGLCFCVSYIFTSTCKLNIQNRARNRSSNRIASSFLMHKLHQPYAWNITLRNILQCERFYDKKSTLEKAREKNLLLCNIKEQMYYYMYNYIMRNISEIYVFTDQTHAFIHFCNVVHYLSTNFLGEQDRDGT